ncbi:hypothetical protein DHEL01_v211387 [Diaporthe helianthi]|uniref:SnodProt1 n=1 Tax=Diaporthe helianthi TaxID=158607 RepID=A0A2P5HIY5_DIAHE|nr:hypothetical protein DHEL01_v211387 [Diaporthe helianthi]
MALGLGLVSAQSTPATISYNSVFDSAYLVANTACGGAEGPNAFSTLAAAKGWTTLNQFQANLVASPLAVNRTFCGQCFKITVGENSTNALVADAAQSVWVLGQSPEWTSISAGSFAGQLQGTVEQLTQDQCVTA